MMDKKIAKEKENKTLRFKVVSAVVVLVTVISIVSGSLSAYFSYESTQKCLQKSMLATTKSTSQIVSNKLSGLESLIGEISRNNIVYDSEIPVEEKNALLAKEATQYGFVNGFIISKDGISIQDGTDYSSSDFFQASKSGKFFVTTPSVDKKSNELTITLSAPIWDSGKTDSSVIGVICFSAPQSTLNTIIENTKVSENGNTYLVDKNGYTIADPDVQLVKDKENIPEQAKTDSSLASLAAIYSKAMGGDTGFGKYTYHGVKKFVAYSSVAGTDGWSLCVGAPEKDFTQGVTTSIYSSIIIGILSILCGTLISLAMTKTLSVPLTAIMNRLMSFAEGDVSSPVPAVETTSFELDNLKTAFNRTTEYTHAVIEDIDYLLTEFSNGNLDVYSNVPEKYVGDYQNILVAFRRLKQGLSESFSEILQVAEQVAEGSSQVSDGAQTLAQGATEQASSLQELSASIADVSQRVTGNAADAENAEKLSTNAATIMQSSVADMKFAQQAIEEISTTSKDISKVIKAIDDIAFQTNILALNAAVEAARAGAAGKGFAVVADEVRNLSQKSAEAAKSTTALIESSIVAVEKGTELVRKTSEDFSEAAAETDKVSKLVEGIAVQAQEQAAAITQISIGIEQISSVVQMNSATSEESAAASEELSSQAGVLKGLAGKIKLDKSYMN